MVKPTVAQQVAEAIKPFVAQVEGLANEVKSLKPTTPSDVAKSVQSEAPRTIPADVHESEPIPAEVRGIVDTILNKDFGIRINSQPGAFHLHILVPRKYSNASPAHWETFLEDDHSSVIERHKGLEGVKEWVNRVFNNLSQDSRTQIIIDRNNGTQA